MTMMLPMSGVALLVVLGAILLRKWILSAPPEPSKDTRDASVSEIIAALPRPLLPLKSGGKPVMKLSWVRPIIVRYVEQTWAYHSPVEKVSLVSRLLEKVKETGAYDFIE